MPSRRRYLVLAVLALAALVGLVAGHGLAWLSAQLNLANPQVAGLAASGWAAAAVAAGVATFVLRHPASRALAEEIVEELGRVSWPGREETGHATLVVVVTVVVCSLYLGLFDAMWMWVTDWMLGARGPSQGFGEWTR